MGPLQPSQFGRFGKFSHLPSSSWVRTILTHWLCSFEVSQWSDPRLSHSRRMLQVVSTISQKLTIPTCFETRSESWQSNIVMTQPGCFHYCWLILTHNHILTTNLHQEFSDGKFPGRDQRQKRATGLPGPSQPADARACARYHPDWENGGERSG